MIYQLHELNRQLLAPFTELAQANAKIFGTDAMRTAIGLMDQGAEGLDAIKALARW